ncbi:hypothetical protein E0K89_000880 [Aquicoccus sp. SCR17]|nr:hypothetical protein [Carideicomes alvinocaridis]
MTARLFEPLTLRGLTLKNRVVVSPMQTYSAPDALPGAWHRVHLGRFALGGAGLVMGEATAVSPEGRSTADDLGLWSDDQERAMAELARAVQACGAAFGLQLQHAGRKASTTAPWQGFANAPIAAGSEVLGPSAHPASEGAHLPRAMTTEDMDRLVAAFAEAARRADRAGVDLVEIHMAHGYLLHSFLSPLANARRDDYGGSLANRMRFPLRIAKAVRKAWPQEKPLACRISSVDGVGIGWTLEESADFAKALAGVGVDLVDCSSGGMTLPERGMLVPRAPGFQLPFAAELRRVPGIATIAVGIITDARQAEAAIASGQADLVALGREMLENPNWALQAANALEPEQAYTRWPVPFGWWLKRRARASR